MYVLPLSSAHPFLADSPILSSSSPYSSFASVDMFLYFSPKSALGMRRNEYASASLP